MIVPVVCQGVVDFAMTPMAEYADLINQYAEVYGVNPLHIAAIILVESGGDLGAYNERSKATGLMQVMPFEAGPLFSDRPTVEELKDPETNIKWGTRILAGYLVRHESLFIALYYYSGGGYWKSAEDFAIRYYGKFYAREQELLSAGVEYKSPHQYAFSIVGNSKANELSLPRD